MSKWDGGPDCVPGNDILCQTGDEGGDCLGGDALVLVGEEFCLDVFVEETVFLEGETIRSHGFQDNVHDISELSPL